MKMKIVKEALGAMTGVDSTARLGRTTRIEKTQSNNARIGLQAARVEEFRIRYSLRQCFAAKSNVCLLLNCRREHGSPTRAAI